MTDEEKYRAIAACDAACDGLFYYGVVTTGIYCRPSCPSRTPKRENLRFFASREEAEAAGFRPCKRCRPDLDRFAPGEEAAAAVRQAVARHYANPQALRQELDALGLDRRHLTRLFERTCGHSVQEELQAVRLTQARALLDRGCTATETAFAVGFGSSAAFTAFFRRQTGLTPSQYAVSRQQTAVSCRISTPVGTLCLTAEGEALTGAAFVEGPADAAPQSGPLAQAAGQLAEYFSGSRREFHLPLRPRGSGFQQRVWQALQQIPYGQTRSYGQIAEAIGAPKAARAVGLACNRNPLLILIPCHRVVGRDGRLVGYAGGLDRKERLLSLEARTLG